MTEFAELGLAAPLLKALAAAGYTTPTPIQAQAIPHLLKGADLLGIAQTGTGKTAAFALPILQRLMGTPRPYERKTTRCLVLAPTRELAAQIAESFRTYGRQTNVRVALIFGGVPKGRQITQLANGVDVIVATPGRLLDLFGEGHVRLDRTEVLVLDEADHMLDLGFVIPIKRIARELPAVRQSLFFSATMPKEIASLAGSLLRNPVEVSVTPVAATADRIDQSVVFVNQSEKRAVLTRMLRAPEMGRTLVFARTKHGADRIVQHLAAAGLNASAIHGNKSPGPARARAGRLQKGLGAGADRDRHRRPRHRRGRRDARDQFRPARRAGSLCSPHRPHGARGCCGPGDQPVRRRRTRAAARDREADTGTAADRGLTECLGYLACVLVRPSSRPSPLDPPPPAHPRLGRVSTRPR